MPTRVDTLPIFDRDARRLRRKYPSLTDTLANLADELKRGQRPGTRVLRVAAAVHKVRLPNPSAGRGKSGGFRILYHVKSRDQVILIALYSKTERADITDAEIRQRVTAAESH